jgi:uncharacterized repeat protein (TIGR02543 family)
MGVNFKLFRKGDVMKSLAKTLFLALMLSGIAFSQTEIQAEDAILSGACVQSLYSGYTGTGYVYIVAETGNSAELAFQRTTAATDSVTIYYSNGSGGTRTLSIAVNDVIVVSTVSFPKTSNWTTWTSLKVAVPFQAGLNRIKFATVGTSTNPILDKISIAGETGVLLYKLTLLKSGTGSVSATPSQTYYNAGSSVTLSATPSSGSVFSRWTGTMESSSNPFDLMMDGNKTEVGVMLDTIGSTSFPFEASPQGFASVNAMGQNGTTGGVGTGGQVVYVTTTADFFKLMADRADADHALGLPPLTVYIVGTLSADANTQGSSDEVYCKEAYNISIIGVGNDAICTGFGLAILKSQNIIVRNIRFASCPNDGMIIQYATTHHVWVDHCTFTDTPPPGYPSFSYYDGALDVTHTPQYVTISWCHFTNHSKTCLMGHSDSYTADVDMKVTYHHNWFDSTIQRHPRVRYGKAHVYNNYYYKNSIYGVSSNDEADVMVEGNYFQNLTIPTETSRDGAPQGDLVERYNIFDNCGTPGTRGTAFEPTTFYSYSIDSASTIPAMLRNYAGSGKFDYSVSNKFTLSVSAVNGSVTKNPNQATYDSGATVQLTATPFSGYQFTGWSGDLSGSTNPVSIVMTASKSITANFALVQFNITASAGANGSISPSGVVAVNSGANRLFTIIPATGYHIDSVIVDGMYQGTSATYQFTNVTASHTIRATFAQNPSDQFTISITTANGSVTKNPDQSLYLNGTSVVLTAVPATGYHFISWSGDTTGTANPFTIIMNGNKNITATFAINTYALNIILAGSGSVAKNPDQTSYSHGTSVTLTATPQAGYLFSGWSGSASGTTNPLTITMDTVKNITATFTFNSAVKQSNGAGGGLWTDASTWAGGVVPTSSDDVIILGLDSVYVTATGATCKSLTLNSGARFYQSSTSSTNYVTITNVVTLLSNSTFYQAGSSASLPGSSYSFDNTGKVVFCGSQSAITKPTTYGTLAVGYSSSETNITPSSGLTINGDLLINFTKSTVVLRGAGSSSLTHTILGNVYIYRGTLSGADGTNSATASWNIGGSVFINSATRGGARLTAVSSSSANGTGIYNIGGNLTISNGRLSAGTSSTAGPGIAIINLKGNLTLSDSAFIATNSTGPFVINFVGNDNVQTVKLDSSISVSTSLYDTVAAGAEVVFDLGKNYWRSTTGGAFVVNGILTLKDSSLIKGLGSFTLNPGATLRIGCANGLTVSDTAGNIGVSGIRTFSTTANYEFNGSIPQMTGDGFPGTVNNFTLSNASGIGLTNSVTIGGMLTMNDGTIATGLNTIALGSAGSVARTSGHIVGNFQKNIPAGSVTRTFEVGDATSYTPIVVAFGNVITSGNLTASVTNTDNPHIATSGINPARSVNRYFTLSNNGVVFNTCEATLNYVSSDLDSNTNPSLFAVRKYDAGIWTSPTFGTITSTSAQVTGLTSFSEFAIGEIAGLTYFTLTVNATNGSVTKTPDLVQYDSGRTVQLTPVGATGYHFVNWTGDATGADDPLSIIMDSNKTINASFAINTYVLTPSAYSHGTISPSTPVTVNYNDSQRFTFSASAGYHIDSILIDGIKVDSSDGYTFANVSSNHTIVVKTAVNTFAITASSGSNGAIVPSGAVMVNYGANQQFVFSPATGYHVDTVLVDGAKVDSAMGYTFINVLTTHTIAVKYAINTFTISATSGPNGTITPAGAVVIDYNASRQFTFVASSGYHVDSLFIDGIYIPDSTASYTFTSVTLSHTIYVTFAPNAFTITATSSANGSIVPAGSVDVSNGGNQRFVFNSSIGYHVDSVVVDGVLVPDSLTGYTFINVKAVHTLHVIFKINTYTITVSSGAHGSVNPGTTVVNYGTDQRFEYIPSAGYHADTILIDGMSVPDSTTGYTFKSVSSAHTLYVGFAINSYTITIVQGSNGIVTPGTTVLLYGSNQRFLFTPNTGYKVDSVVIDGVINADSTSAFTFINVAGRHTLYVTFNLQPVYAAKYRTFVYDSLMVKKALAKKATKEYWEFKIKNNTTNAVSQVNLVFKNAVATILESGSMLPVGSNKTWTLAGSLASGDSIILKGRSPKAATQLIAKLYMGPVSKTPTEKNVMALKSIHELPMPNAANVREDLFKRGGFPSGLVIGYEQTSPVMMKLFGWVKMKKSGDMLKSLYDKKGPHSIIGTGFNTFVKGLGSLPPSKQNNKTFADLLALKFNIALSSLRVTENGFGELMYIENGNPFDGMLLRDIAIKGDSMMTYCANYALHPDLYGKLDTVLMKINGAFSAPIDTVSWSDTLKLKGTESLINIGFLRATGVQPAIVIPKEMPDAVEEVPATAKLYQNYPNPFNPSTMIQFDLPNAAIVTLKIFNVLGQEMATLLDRQEMTEGGQQIQFSATDFASGVYFYRIQAEGLSDESGNTPTTFTSVRKMILVK